ncbi:hypothetical protein CONLIGDRAFT_681082 [Coniochaeta ligniaria NRRL 30616]|uniref:Uncharacterized protein n=1 Tax=Coniochaeta ligniaria NRRL 30616 TaxID=1408157 RepID=A0A1J7JRC0_9PEZI|nr:hypothetical protein CONLIGDRAFT_681082 [Coniochaeta ligniaria NRRL 30616]
MAQVRHGNEGYSTLEVSHTYDNQPQKEVAPSYGDNLPQAVHPDGVQHQAPEYYKPEGTTPAPYYDPKQQYTSETVGLNSLEGQRERRKKCGLAPRTFWIVVAACSLVVIAAIVGGVVGGVLSNRKSDSPQQGGNGTSSDGGGGDSNPGAAANSTAVTLLGSSKVAAVNWTDTNSFSHYAVFSQDSTNSLMVSLWDSQNQTWSAVNISDALLLSGSPVRAKPGTPLSAVSTGPPTWTFQMDLYYLTPSNNIQEVYSRDMDGRNWAIGDLGKSPKTADDNSPLASVWHRCDHGCSGFIYVAYLSNSNIQVLNGSDWAQTQNLVEVDSGSPLALFPFTSYDPTSSNPSNQYGQDPELRLYATQNGGNLGELKFTVDREWVGGHGIASNLPNNPLPQVAGAPFDYWFGSQLTLLNNDGTLSATFWDNSTSTWNELTHTSMRGGQVGGFKAIAQHHERRLYAVVNGTVQEYRWEQSDPLTMISVGKVTLATDLVKP